MLMKRTIIGDDKGRSAEIWATRPPVLVSAPVTLIEVWRDGNLRQVRVVAILDEPADGVEQGL